MKHRMFDARPMLLDIGSAAKAARATAVGIVSLSLRLAEAPAPLRAAIVPGSRSRQQYASFDPERADLRCEECR